MLTILWNRRLLVRLDHVASDIVSANNSTM
jgi:hypothetical protein